MFVEKKFIEFLHALQLHRKVPHGKHSRIHEGDHHRMHEVYQTSTINALLEGIYDGDMTYGQLREHGDFGLGTFNALDGEMIAFDGRFYQIKSDGVASLVNDAQKTPFAVVQFFEAEIEEGLDRELGYEQLKAYLHSLIPTTNFFYAIRIDGLFKYMKTRSVPRQVKPYPPLIEVTKTQPVFEFADVAGTIAGFRFPDYAQGINVPGYHLHFLTEDRRAGGHLLDCRLQHGKVLVEHTSNFHMELPTQGTFLEADLAKDQRETLHQAEE
jgi:acetolactate decarboxylase